MIYGCPERKNCYMKEIDCFFSQRYPCIHLDTILHLRHDKEMKELADRRIREKARLTDDLDYILQMEIGCI